MRQTHSKLHPTRKLVNEVNLSSFQLKKLFQICAYVISARKVKGLDVTTTFVYSNANMPLGQLEPAYNLSYFLIQVIYYYYFVQEED